MPLESRHIIRKRSKERQIAGLVENSKLYKEAIAEVMKQRAETLRCYKVIRELQSAIHVYQTVIKNRTTRDQEETQTDPGLADARPAQPEITL